MMQKENARTTAATVERATAETTACRASIPIFNCTTADEGRQSKKIEPLLLHGANNAIPSKTLAKMAGCSSVRQLQSVIASERANGALILSTCRNGGGYFLPADGPGGREEIIEYTRTLRARALNTLRALKSARAALATLDGQFEIVLWREREENNGQTESAVSEKAV